MNKYNVRVPFAGYIDVEVEAPDENTAKEVGFSLASCSYEMKELSDVEFKNQCGDADCVDFAWETYECTGQGNVTYLECNEIEVDKLN